HVPLPLLTTTIHHPHIHTYPTRRSSDLERRRVENPRQRQTLSLQPGVLEVDVADCPAQGGDDRERVHLLPEEVRRVEVRTDDRRSEEHTSELQSRFDLVCRLLLEKKK